MPKTDITITTKKKIKTIATATAFTTGCGLLYPFLFGEFHLHTFINAGAIGFIIGFVSSTAEGLYFNTLGQRLRFSLLLIIRTLFYVLLIGGSTIFVVGYHLTFMHSISFFETFETPQFQEFVFGGEFLTVMVYALAASFGFNFVRQVNRMLGQNVLLSYVTGKYHRPIEEERIFMFLDLKSSTQIAEKLGHKRYHQFLNDFFFDITPAVLESNGEIYQYVGDEVVITWGNENGLRNANCIKCYFVIAATIHRSSHKYESRYGIVPTFKAGYHIGVVTAGEIGDIKKDIVFHGDTVNTAARIRSECSVLGLDLLLSGDLLKRIPIDEILTPERIGKIRLRGKDKEVELFSIKEAA